MKIGLFAPVFTGLARVFGIASLIALGTTVIITQPIYAQRNWFFSRGTPKELVDEVWQIIDRKYVDRTFNQVNWQAVRKEYLSRSYTNKQEAYKAG